MQPKLNGNGHPRQPLGAHSDAERGERQSQRRHQSRSERFSSSSSAASFKGCCCCLFLLLSLLALIAVAIALVVILALKPKRPQFDLQQVGVQYMGITAPPSAQSVGSSSASISLTINMLFTAMNPNKVGIKYKNSKFTIMYRGIPLGDAIIPGFFQAAHSHRRVVATIAVDRFSLLQADAADIVRDASINDRVEFSVRGEVSANIRLMDHDSPTVGVSINCAIVISPKNQSLTYKDCGFDGLSV